MIAILLRNFAARPELLLKFYSRVVPTDMPPHERWLVDHQAWGALFQATWYLNKEEEPLNDSGKSILDRWLNYIDTDDKKGWSCCVPLHDHEDTWCTKEFNRFDRAIVHIRGHHLGLKPYPCEGGCKAQNWYAKK